MTLYTPDAAAPPVEHRELRFLQAVQALSRADSSELVRAPKAALRTGLAYDEALALIARLAERDLLRSMGDPTVLSEIQLTLTVVGRSVAAATT